jgi:hypothetical protein
VAGNGDCEYDGVTVYSFASDFIFQWLVNKHNAQMLAGAVGMFSCGAASETYGAVSAGNMFEKICLWLKPLDGLHITAASLEGGAAVTLDIPAEIHVLSHDWKKTAQLHVNVLILPRISNLESGDAFYVVPCGPDSILLVIFQTTVGKSHPVKVNGLHDILLAFPERVRNKITHKFLVFVIPKHGTPPRQGHETAHSEGRRSYCCAAYCKRFPAVRVPPRKLGIQCLVFLVFLCN